MSSLGNGVGGAGEVGGVGEAGGVGRVFNFPNSELHRALPFPQGTPTSKLRLRKLRLPNSVL